MTSDPDALSRRELLVRAGLLGAVAALAPLPRVAERYGLLPAASAAADDVAVDTLRGLAAYVVPGDDIYSVVQGQATRRPGGIEAGAAEGLRATLDVSGAGVAEAAVAILNAEAASVHPGGGTGRFSSQFAALSFALKDLVFSRLGQSSDEVLQALAGTLPAVVAFLAYSEFAVLDPKARRLRSTPVAWRITGYPGVADIHDEFRGYLGGRRSAHAGDA